VKFVHASYIKFDIHFEWMKKIHKNIIGRENIVMSVRYYIDNNKNSEHQMHFIWGRVFSIHPSVGNDSMLFM